MVAVVSYKPKRRISQFESSWNNLERICQGTGDESREASDVSCIVNTLRHIAQAKGEKKDWMNAENALLFAYSMWIRVYDQAQTFLENITPQNTSSEIVHIQQNDTTLWHNYTNIDRANASITSRQLLKTMEQHKNRHRKQSHTITFVYLDDSYVLSAVHMAYDYNFQTGNQAHIAAIPPTEQDQKSMTKFKRYLENISRIHEKPLFVILYKQDDEVPAFLRKKHNNCVLQTIQQVNQPLQPGSHDPLY